MSRSRSFGCGTFFLVAIDSYDKKVLLFLQAQSEILANQSI